MKIRYDATALLAGIGLVPWTRIGPEQWFEHYKIASLSTWDLPEAVGPEVIALAQAQSEVPPLAKKNTQHLVMLPEFQELLRKELPDYSYLTYRGIEPPKSFSLEGRFTVANIELNDTLENKVEFRRVFGDLGLPFPQYRVWRLSELHADSVVLKQLLDGHEAVVLQDEATGGGRGTRIIRDLTGLKEALELFQAFNGNRRLVVSQFVPEARERSVQCVTTRYGTFVGPLQKQIIAHPLLANTDVIRSDRFCGGEITTQDPLAKHYESIRRCALAIGDRLQKLGYRGIFSLDCLIGKDGLLYILEINPRVTGMTPLLTALYREGKDIPFYLLHILETAGMDYEIEDTEVAEQSAEGALLLLHSDATRDGRLLRAPQSGLYDRRTTRLIARDYHLSKAAEQDTMVIQQYQPVGFNVKAGGRLLTIMTDGPVTDDRDELLPDIRQIIQRLRTQLTVEDIV